MGWENKRPETKTREREMKKQECKKTRGEKITRKKHEIGKWDELDQVCLISVGANCAELWPSRNWVWDQWFKARDTICPRRFLICHDCFKMWIFCLGQLTETCSVSRALSIVWYCCPWCLMKVLITAETSFLLIKFWSLQEWVLHLFQLTRDDMRRDSRLYSSHTQLYRI